MTVYSLLHVLFPKYHIGAFGFDFVKVKVTMKESLIGKNHSVSQTTSFTTVHCT